MLIDVKETHPPRGPRRSGTIVAMDGTQFDCWPKLMQTIKVGQRYEVEASTNERGYTSITKATPVSGDAATANGHDHSGQISRSAPDEVWFVGQQLHALILKGDVIYTKKSLYDATELLRGLYAATFGGQKGNSHAGSH